MVTMQIQRTSLRSSVMLQERYHDLLTNGSSDLAAGRLITVPWYESIINTLTSQPFREYDSGQIQPPRRCFNRRRDTFVRSIRDQLKPR